MTYADQATLLTDCLYGNGDYLNSLERSMIQSLIDERRVAGTLFSDGGYTPTGPLDPVPGYRVLLMTMVLENARLTRALREADVCASCGTRRPSCYYCGCK